MVLDLIYLYAFTFLISSPFDFILHLPHSFTLPRSLLTPDLGHLENQ